MIDKFGKTLWTIFVAALFVMINGQYQKAAAQCTIKFNNRDSLSRLPNQARLGYVSYPWYSESCGNMGSIYFIPKNSNQYLLYFEDSTIGGCFINNGMGRLINGQCVAPDWAGEDRYAITHSARNAISFYFGRDKKFSLGNLWIKDSSAVAKVSYLKDGQWWVWNRLPPGYWNLSSATGISQVDITSADGEGAPVSFDWIDIRN
jgi:hypothetical protein